ncbi:hypothetical protein FRC07_011415 [Ceratobasidium sp. 392]|nr:hypothetical protein FRC07_011415 [Ceratobasidium sp. 392]
MRWVSLIKEPTKRATYAELLEHPWLVADRTRDVDMPAWVASAVAYRDAKREQGAEVSSSDATVPDRATVEAAVNAGEVVSQPEVNGTTEPNGVDSLADAVAEKLALPEDGEAPAQ